MTGQAEIRQIRRAEVELCVQRRTALEQIGEGVPDWEDENIEQAPDITGCP